RARDDRREASADALESMQDMAANMRGRADEMQKIAEAARPLYDTLDRRQRRLLTRFVQRDWIMSGMQMSGYGADETGRR
ncbi:MAG: hypothetical protein JWN93_926, partial [Hyphomicrobiales bacterium]|nr:hypothetical protein [Hyphomicrobiales bacterium]